MDKRSLREELNKLFRAMNYIADNYLSKEKLAQKRQRSFTVFIKS